MGKGSLPFEWLQARGSEWEKKREGEDCAGLMYHMPHTHTLTYTHSPTHTHLHTLTYTLSPTHSHLVSARQEARSCNLLPYSLRLGLHLRRLGGRKTVAGERVKLPLPSSLLSHCPGISLSFLIYAPNGAASPTWTLAKLGKLEPATTLCLLPLSHSSLLPLF